MTWILYNVAAHKEVQDALRDEVKALSLTEGFATPKDLQKMALMKACIKESLRYMRVMSEYNQKSNRRARYKNGLLKCRN